MGTREYGQSDRNRKKRVGRKEMFYLTKEGNVLFNDALNTFYSRLYGRKEEFFYLTTHSAHFIYGYVEGRKKMFYLTTHSTHFIYGYTEGRNKNVLFNDALNTFFLRLYGVRHMLKDHSDS